VDIREFNWNGWCGCRRMEFFAGQLERGAAPCDSMRCAHIRRARSCFLDEMLPELAKALDASVK
jgi:hypothetical protein